MNKCKIENMLAEIDSDNFVDDIHSYELLTDGDEHLAEAMYQIDNCIEDTEDYEIFFKKLFNVDIRENDGTMKCLYDIFKEASENFRNWK